MAKGDFVKQLKTQKYSFYSLGIIAVCFIVFTTMYNATSGQREQAKELVLTQSVSFSQGDSKRTVNYDALKDIGIVSFEATYDTSKTEPEKRSYEGVELIEIVKSIGFTVNEQSVVTLTAADGYAVAYSGKELLTSGNVYVAVTENGKALGTKDEGGSGPYMTIVVGDQFSNRRCKYLVSVSIS